MKGYFFALKKRVLGVNKAMDDKILRDFGVTDREERPIYVGKQLGVKDLYEATITNRRVIFLETGHLKYESIVISVPIYNILEVELVKRKGMLGDVYIRTLVSTHEIKVRDYKTAKEMYEILNKVIFAVKTKEVRG